MDIEELKNILAFLRKAEQLKNTIRSGYTSTGRTESVAEHTWRLCLMVLILEPYFPEANILRLIKICIVHDLGEAINGDIPAPAQIGSKDKAEDERRDLLQLAADLPDQLQNEVVALWDEYEQASTAEAKIAKAFDKLETIIQHNQGKTPRGFDYAFNLDYGREYTSAHPIIACIRQILDDETRKLADESE